MVGKWGKKKGKREMWEKGKKRKKNIHFQVFSAQ